MFVKVPRMPGDLPEQMARALPALLAIETGMTILVHYELQAAINIICLSIAISCSCVHSTMHTYNVLQQGHLRQAEMPTATGSLRPCKPSITLLACRR